jgi:hypothetical protein
VPVPTGPFRQVAEVIRLAKAQGCELRTAKFRIVTPDGVKPIRYLHNPKTGGTYDISDFEDDEYMAPSTIRAAERRLGILLGD